MISTTGGDVLAEIASFPLLEDAYIKGIEGSSTIVELQYSCRHYGGEESRKVKYEALLLHDKETKRTSVLSNNVVSDELYKFKQHIGKLTVIGRQTGVAKELVLEVFNQGRLLLSETVSSLHGEFCTDGTELTYADLI